MKSPAIGRASFLALQQFRDAADTRSGSTGLGFQKGNLRSRIPVMISSCRPRLPTRALLQAIQLKYSDQCFNLMMPSGNVQQSHHLALLILGYAHATNLFGRPGFIRTCFASSCPSYPRSRR